MAFDDHYLTCQQVSRSRMGKEVVPGESVEHSMFDVSLRVGRQLTLFSSG